MGLDELYIALNGFDRKPETGDDMPDNSSSALFPFEDRCIEPCTGEKIGSREPCRTGTDNRGLDRSLLCRPFPNLLELLKSILHGDTFHVTDFHSPLVIHTSAMQLALVVADVTGYGRKSVLVIDEGESFAVAALADQLDILRNILMNGACHLTRRYITVEHGKLFTDLDCIVASELLVYFTERASACICRQFL